MSAPRSPERRRASSFGPVRITLIAAASAGVSQSFGRFTYSLLFTDVRDEFALSNTFAGAIGSANLAGYLIGTLVVSLVVGRVGLALTARTGLIAVTAGLVLLAWSPGVGAVVFAMVLTGIAAAAVWVTVPGIAAAAVGEERRATAIGVVTGGVGAGVAAAAALDSTVGGGSWRHVYRAEAIGAVVISCLAVAWLGAARPVARRSGRRGLTILTAVPGWRPLLGSYGLFGFVLSLVVTFMVAALEEDAGYEPAAASLAFSLFGIGTIAGGPAFGILADRLGRVGALTTAFALLAGTAAVIPTGWRPWATIGAAVFGMSFSGVPTIVGARIADVVENDDFGAAFGAATLAFGLGLMLGPQFGGLLSDLTGSFRPGFAVATASGILGGVLAVRAFSDRVTNLHDAGARP